MATIYDNIDSKFVDGLLEQLEDDSVRRVDFCVGYFNLRGWDRIVDRIDQLEGEFVDEGGREPVHRCCRLIIGMFQSNDDAVRRFYSNRNRRTDANYVNKSKQKIAQEFRNQLMLGYPSKAAEASLRRLSAQLKSGKVCVKLYLRERLHAKLYLSYRDERRHPIDAIMGSSNLTLPGLTGQGELDTSIDDRQQLDVLVDWFNRRWEDPFCVDITRELIDAIDNSWAGEKTITPYYIYLKTAYYLSQDARQGISEYNLDPTFQHDLFPFQENAVKIATKHLMNEKHKGAMIGDVVGLGKTITACAIAKIFEDNMSGSTLIICPANLQEMWQDYVKRYDLKATVISNAKPIDIDHARYYRLVIIDESHNLRNAQGLRYRNIKQFIESQDNSVLLLTATPYNKDYSDMSAQLRLFLSDDQDLGIRPEAYIRDLGGENAFKRRHSDIFIRSIKAFEQSPFVEDWNELMKLFLVRRTRTFIKENYAKTDPTNNRKYLEFRDHQRSYFPDRVPRAVKFPTVEGDQYSRLYSDRMISLMADLELPRYGLIKFVNDAESAQASKLEKRLLDNLSRAGKRMMGFCRSTFFKRIDSSGYSFLLTLYRHILRNCVYVYAIDNNLRLPIGDENAMPDDFLDDEDQSILIDNTAEEPLKKIPTDLAAYKKKAERYYNLIASKNNVDWLDSRFFKRTLKTKLNADSKKLIQMILLCGDWNPAEDQKMNSLELMLQTTHHDDKVVVFTQYSDTAEYIYNELRRRGFTHIDYATGQSSNPTEAVKKFSPVSNGIALPKEQQTRVLIATDVLSEGQNLQDAHVIMNFDLPWAIIRLIQRAGRVDRIGQQSDTIFCYSFFPAEGVDKIIHLKDKLRKRLSEAGAAVGNDELFFEGDEVNLTNLYNEKGGILDDADDTDVDLSSQAYEIWHHATQANPALKDIIPHLDDMIYSTKLTDDRFRDGVITYVRTASGFDMLSWLDSHGEVISQSQKHILKAMECTLQTPAEEPLENHFELVAKAAQNIQQSGNTNVSGMLGNRFSTRYRIVTLLEDFYKHKERETKLQGQDMFFTQDSLDELKGAIDDIYNYPFFDTVKTMLGRMLRQTHLSDEDIVNYVLELYRDNALVHKPKTGEEADRDNTIVCSMGLRFKEKE